VIFDGFSERVTVTKDEAGILFLLILEDTGLGVEWITNWESFEQVCDTMARTYDIRPFCDTAHRMCHSQAMKNTKLGSLL